MGKDWDKALPDKNIWRGCYKVLKDGAFAFIMSIPRADCLSRMIISLEDAGFRVNFTPIFWAYASGFPKAQNIGKVVDKKPNRLKALAFRDGFNKLRIAKGFTIKQVNDYFGFAITGSGVAHHWFSHPTQPTVPDNRQYQKLKEWWQLDGSLDDLYYEAEREITGSDGSWGQEGTTPLTRYGEFERKDKPQSPQAKALDGSYGGFQVKPSVEVIIVAMKPLSEKTYVEQALKNKKGITWLDDGRIPYQGKDDRLEGQSSRPKSTSKGMEFYSEKGDDDFNRSDRTNLTGRFPANLICSDDVLNDGRITKSGYMEGKHTAPNSYGGFNTPTETMTYPDTGSFSRYFDLDKWFEERIKFLPKSAQKTFPFLIVPKASKSEKNKGCEDLPRRPVAERAGRDNTINSKLTLEGKSQSISPPERNYHPTVKPLKLMSYLITLGSREGDLVLDPFMGSGTTGIACKLLDREFLGCEINKEYFEIAQRRIESIPSKFDI